MKAIIAINRLGFIGLNNGIPWRCSADLKHFKELTYGHFCLVGRKTYEGLPPLGGRELIVLSGSSPRYHSLGWAVATIQANDGWVIGGATVYEQTLHECSELHISIINDYTVGDTMCPNLRNFKGEIFVYEFEPNAKKVA